MTSIAFVGTGYVCDLYLASLEHHRELDLVGVFDRDASRAGIVASSTGARRYDSLEELLDDQAAEIVVNLTNPGSHYEISRAALLAGKHVYSEKPLALDFSEARELVELARSSGLELSGAPCSVLGETAMTLWREVDAGRIGRVRVIHAELDDGPVHQLPIGEWRSASGFGWPYEDEFRTGCTLEHAGYYLTWLTMFFGPVRRITAFSKLLVPDKPGLEDGGGAPDFSVGCLEFDHGVVARITNGLLAPEDHSLTIVGDDGILKVDNGWDYQSPVRFSRHALRPKIARSVLLSRALGYGPSPIRLVGATRRRWWASAPPMDYCRGISAMARAIALGSTPLLSAEHALHITELSLTLQYPESMGSPRKLETTFAPLAAPTTVVG